MFDTVIRDYSSVCLYGNDGGDYEEQNIQLIIECTPKECVYDCPKCQNYGNCGAFFEKATIHHHIEDIDNGEEMVESFFEWLQELQEMNSNE